MAEGKARLRDKYAIAGVMAWRAVADAKLKMTDMAAVTAQATSIRTTKGSASGSESNARFSTSVDNGGASQVLAVALAVMAIDAGLCSTVLCGYDHWHPDRTQHES